MHDPMTVAFRIPYPWWKHRPGSKMWKDGYRETAVTIWHVDPESDGSDDSCGWSRPRFTEADRKLADDMCEWEQKFPHYFAATRRVTNPEYPNLWKVAPGDASMLVLGAWDEIAWRLDRKRLSPALALQAMRLGNNAMDNFASSLAATDVEDQRRALLFIIASYRRATRPWYRHPRWHVRHWKLQIAAFQAFKRWAFTRCNLCGGRFAWGETGIGTWAGDGPRWFKSEHLTHMNCAGVNSKPSGVANV